MPEATPSTTGRRKHIRLRLGCLALLAFVAFCNREPSRDGSRQRPRPAAVQTAARLDVQFAGVCPAGWRERPAPFGDGRIGVNTVFRSATRQSIADRNVLELYFFDVARERATPPRVPLGAEYVWVVERHDTDARYRYRADGVRVCWRVR